ncbi:hypothetical protein K470DRAFT_256994 [Piedraia hortae CBS 480.64]|uniref:MICOS complex subunit MIC60 n=1 Tax=Piedraia hortae CBS 480.64 TaxID=1314780 RepID=A0A6A7C2S1_9PEZI|nr:hypothetical protein K470DRAFT_256994 [Piedraia hortae CBS 480.64]
MLRQAVARSARRVDISFPLRTARAQWIAGAPLKRTFADHRMPIPPDSPSNISSGVPQGRTPGLDGPKPEISNAIPKAPPSPSEVASKPPPPPTSPASNLSSPPPSRPRHRFRRFLILLVLFSALGYGGSVYLALINDNYHDFFTEYIPFGEEVVAYFQERAHRKRFPLKRQDTQIWGKSTGEPKVTIAPNSGVKPRVAEVSSSDSADKPASSSGQFKPPKEDAAAVPAVAAPKAAKTSEVPKAAAAVDHLALSHDSEQVVQDLVKMVNNVITAVNASADAPKLASTVQTLKSDLDRIVGQLGSLKESMTKDAQGQINNAHSEFDKAAQELVKRLELEMKDQESKWREEYEKEQEKLRQSYENKLSAELEAARKVSEEKGKNALLQQEISLQQRYMANVRSKVEEERDGRLGKLEELSHSMEEIRDVMSGWNNVVDAALRTQHLQVAVEAVRAKVLEAEQPTPFVDELVALKAAGGGDSVVEAAIASINPVAYQRGIPSAASLIDRFRRVAAEVRKASLLPEDAGVAAHAASAVLSRLMFAKKTERGLPEGDDVEATLARTDAFLEEGNLDAAAREMNSLKGWAGVLSRDWVGECRRVLEVRQAVDVMATEARLQSLLVE